MLLLFLLFPIVALPVSLKYFKNINSRNWFWYFCVYSGFVFIYQPEGEVLGTGADGGRYALDLIDMHNNIGTISDLFHSEYVTTSLDYYQVLVTYIISRFTIDAHWLFLVFALVFGFFYSRNIWFVFDRLPGQIPLLYWILVFYYILISPIWNINGVRMWTALHIFVYGAMPYLMDNNRNKLVWCLLAVLVHFSFIIPVVILLLYIVVKTTHVKIYFLLYILSLCVHTIDLVFIRNIIEQIPLLSSKSSYLGDSYIEKISEAKFATHVILAQEFSYWILQILIFFSFMLISKDKERNNKYIRLYTFSLLIYSVANVLSAVPSGSRFIVLSQMFMLPVILFLLLNNLKYYNKRILGMLILPLLITIVFKLRVGMDYFSVMLFIGNFLTSPFISSELPLIELIKIII